MRLILASGSAARASVLADAGLVFDSVPADIDERAAAAPLEASGAEAGDVALVLAEAKASLVSERFPDALVIGADQTLDLHGAILSKPADMESARRQLLAMSGKTHSLHSAVVLARAGAILWQTVETAHLTMRRLTPEYVGRYLAAVGPAALSSVGAYQIEGRGIQLFERIDGDHFTILGLPILPLLAALRAEGAVET